MKTKSIILIAQLIITVLFISILVWENVFPSPIKQVIRLLFVISLTYMVVASYNKVFKKKLE